MEMAENVLDAIAWTRFQPRTSALASALGGQARYLNDGLGGAHFAMRPLAYIVKAYQTCNLLSRAKPRTGLVITPPVFAPFVAWLRAAPHMSPLVVASHTSAFHSAFRDLSRP